MKLNPLQQSRLAAVAETSKLYRSARVNLEVELRARLRAELEAELGGLRNRRDIAAFRAFQAGVPKSRIGVDGLGTKNPQTHTDAIEAGRIAIAGTLEDTTVRDDLIEAVTPKENPFVHPRGGFFADVEPWPLRASDKPGVVILSAYGDDDGVKRDEPHEVELQLSEAGTVQTVEIMAPLNAVIHHPKWGKPVRDAALVIFKAMGENV